MFQIQNCHDVYVDGCVRNEAGILMFLSAFGRDTAIKELMARIQIGSAGSSGLPALKLKGVGEHDGEIYTVVIANAKDLEKTTGRLPKCLYGNLTHLWIYDPVIQAPNKSTGVAWVIEPQVASEASKRVSDDLSLKLWQAICQLANIPLLSHWREPLMTEIQGDLILKMGDQATTDFRLRHSRPLGPLDAYRIELTEDFPQRVCEMIRQGKLKAELV